MHLTLLRMTRRKQQPNPMKLDKWIRKESLKSQARIFWNKPKRNRYSMYTVFLTKALQTQALARVLRFRGNNMLRNHRLDAVCEQHQITRPEFIGGLRKSKIQISKGMLSMLAIYEPRTFEGLVEVADRANIELKRGRTEILPEHRLTSTKETEI